MQFVFFALLVLLAWPVESRAVDLGRPGFTLTQRTFVFDDEAQSDTRLVAGWQHVSLATGIDLSAELSLRHDTSGMTEVAFDELNRNDRLPAIAANDLYLRLTPTAWSSGLADALGGTVYIDVGKQLFPLAGVGDLVRPNDVLVPRNLAHSPVLREQALAPTTDDRLTQYGVSVTHVRDVPGRYRLVSHASFIPFAVPNRYPTRGPWSLLPDGASFDDDLPTGSDAQQWGADVCMLFRQQSMSLCAMAAGGPRKVPVITPTSPTSFVAEYPREERYGVSIEAPMPYLDSVSWRAEGASIVGGARDGGDQFEAIGAVEMIDTLLGHDFFLLGQGMWRTNSDPDPFFVNTVLNRGALARLRIGSVYDDTGLSLQLDAGINVDPEGYVVAPTLFLPFPWGDDVADWLDIFPPVLRVGGGWFGGSSEHLFGGPYEDRAFGYISLVFEG